VWAYELSYAKTGYRQIGYATQPWECAGMRAHVLALVESQFPSMQPSATTCRQARVFDSQGAHAAEFAAGFRGEAPPQRYWAYMLRATGGAATSTEESCRRTERTFGASGGGCVPVLILFVEPPAAEAT